MKEYLLRTERFTLLVGAILLVVLGLAISVSGETHTWDTYEEMEPGSHNATHWDQEHDGVALGIPETWWKHYGNPVVSEGSSGEYDDLYADDPSLVMVNSTFYMYYSARNATDYSFGLATSQDGLTWTKHGTPVLGTGASGAFDEDTIREPCVIHEDGMFKMWYAGTDSGRWGIGYAYSHDGFTWTKYGTKPVLETTSSGWGYQYIRDPFVIRIGGTYHMYLSGGTSSTNKEVGLALGTSEVQWKYHDSNPVVENAPTGVFGADSVYEPTVVRDDPVYRMFFSGRATSSDHYEVGEAWSYDGKVWTLETDVVLGLGDSTTWDDHFITDPDVIWHNGSLMMAYHGTDGLGQDDIGVAFLRPWANKDAVSNPFIPLGTTYDDDHMHDPCVVKNPKTGEYHLFYICKGGSEWAVAVATADHPSGPYTKWGGNPIITGTTGFWDQSGIESVCAIYDQNQFKIWFTGYDVSDLRCRIGYAASSSGKTSTKYGLNPIFTNSSDKREWDGFEVRDPWVVKVGNTYHMWYSGGTHNSFYEIGHATSLDGYSWTRDPENPVLTHDLVFDTETNALGRPTVTYKNGQFTMHYSNVYTTIHSTVTHNVWRAVSHDGTHWTKVPHAVVMEQGNSTAWDSGGVSTPCIVNEDGVYHVYYSAHNDSNWRIGYGRMRGGAGTYTTSVLDASALWPVQWNSLSWDADLPTGTSIGFQVSTNNGGDIWDFVGPDGTGDTYFTMNGEGIHQYQTGRYLRVRAYMHSQNMTWWSPVLDSLTVSYERRPNPSPPVIQVCSPNGGEDWMKTKQYPITWTASGNFGPTPIDIYYTRNNGSSWITVATDRTNVGYYLWTVPSFETSGALVRIAATDIDGLSTQDTSDTTFAIDPPPPKTGAFLSPAAGDVLAPGTHGASWVVNDPWGLAELPLTLELTTDGGMTWAVLADALPLSGGVEWDVPALAESSDACRLRLSVLNWLGDISVIESGTFSVDVMAPTVVLGPIDAELAAGEELLVTASATDDLGVRGAVLHVLSDTGKERTYSMDRSNDGTWSSTYLATEGDVSLWVEATDGRHDVESARSDFSVRPKGSSDPTHDYAIVPLAVVIVLLCMLVLMLAMQSLKRGRK